MQTGTDISYSSTYTRVFAVGIAMMQLLGIIGILCCCQVVYSENIYFMPANITQAQEKCYATGLVLPRTSADNMQVAQRLQLTNISATWIDLTITPSSWNWITDDEYAVHHDQGCYNFSSLDVACDNITATNTCMESCAGYLYVGIQAMPDGDNIRCVCTNETEIASSVSEYDCASLCDIISNRQACGNPEKDTFRLLSMRKLSSLLTREVAYWENNNDLDISSPFLCASVLIKDQNGPPYFRLRPQNCTAELPAICEGDNGTVTRMHNVSWFGARQLCREKGMSSVRVSSPNQGNIRALNIEEGWTALRGWTWRSQGREICDTVTANWYKGYPKKSKGKCIVVLKDGSWKNVLCDTEMPFLCVTGGPDVAVAAAAGSVAFLVLTAVTVIIIICLRKWKQTSSDGSSPHTQRDPGDDKSLRPECDQSMDELPIYARPNKDPLTDGVILVVENSLYDSVDLDEDELPSSRPVAMASMGDEDNDDSTSGQEAGDLSWSNSSEKDHVPDDDPLMIDNSLYDSTDSAMDGLPVP